MVNDIVNEPEAQLDPVRFTPLKVKRRSRKLPEVVSGDFWTPQTFSAEFHEVLTLCLTQPDLWRNLE